MKKIENNNEYISAKKDLMKEWNFKKNIGKDPTNLMINSSELVWWKCEKGHEFEAKIKDRVKGKKCPACFARTVIVGINDLETMNRKLAKQWNYEKNIGLTPKDVTSGSNKKVWWKCKNGHEWEAVVSSRNYGTGCPYCTGRKVKIGFNDIETVSPNIAKQWNYEKNIGLTPKDVTSGSNKKVWWKCKKGHEWEADISARIRGNSCPYCAGHKAIKGKNDLLTKNSKLAKEWNYEKNGGLTPEEISYKSHKKVWWKCEKGHTWESSVSSRSNGNGCPVCSGKLIVEGINDLKYLNPILSEEWNYEKNGGLTPNQVGIGSNKKVWWKCKKGHEFEGVINSRNYKKSGCPVCSNRKIVEGYNDLKTLDKRLTKEWNYEKNRGLTPNQVGIGSNKKVWWKCKKGHEWEAKINDRSRGTNCPYCR